MNARETFDGCDDAALWVAALELRLAEARAWERLRNGGPRALRAQARDMAERRRAIERERAALEPRA